MSETMEINRAQCGGARVSWLCDCHGRFYAEASYRGGEASVSGATEAECIAKLVEFMTTRRPDTGKE